MLAPFAPENVLPLKRDKKLGGWITANGNWILKKEGAFWKISDPRPVRVEDTPAGVIIYGKAGCSIPPHRTLKDLLNAVLHQPVKVKTLPLRRSHKGLWLTSSRHLALAMHEKRWYLVRASSQNTGALAVSLGMHAPSDTSLGPLDLWAKMHGLDLPFASRQELVDRLCEAIEKDPPDHILESTKRV